MDNANKVLLRLKQRPSSFGIAAGSNIMKLSPSDLVPLSKKTFVFFLNYEANATQNRIVLCKLAEDNSIKSHMLIDLVAWANLQEGQ